MSWAGWPIERVLLLYVGVVMGGLTIEVFLSHLGGAFHKWQMKIPIAYGPVLMVAGLLLAIFINRNLAIIGFVLFGVGVLVGSVGTYFHLRAIGYYIMGYKLRNFIDGPPPLAPAMFLVTSVLGMLAIYWAVYVR